ncbi:hypothetical protein FA95DRAFT_1611339 [Auriscalpium vulgare]|uniref:Uncharacterized protein n=1 Tax=Auriscalpium vulgare TaxID=40419 RepID=A0ACB8RAB1_9AGAM|nr:hypothetical protein FA95DRAFT_1611339 [Auriscalpium vulgare]
MSYIGDPALELGPESTHTATPLASTSSFPLLPEGHDYSIQPESASVAGSRRSSYLVHPQPPHMNPGPHDVSHCHSNHPQTRGAYGQIMSTAAILSENQGRQDSVSRLNSSTGPSIPPMQNISSHPTSMYQPLDYFASSSPLFTQAQTGISDSDFHVSSFLADPADPTSQLAGRSYRGRAAASSSKARESSTQWDSLSATLVSSNGFGARCPASPGASLAAGLRAKGTFVVDALSAGAKLVPSRVIPAGMPQDVTRTQPGIATLKHPRDGADECGDDDERPSKISRTAQTSIAAGQALTDGADSDEEVLSDSADTTPTNARSYATQYRQTQKIHFKRIRVALGVPPGKTILAAYPDAACRAESASKVIAAFAAVKAMFKITDDERPDVAVVASKLPVV